MALNLPQMPFKLTPQDMGNFDLGSAIGSGLKNYQEGVNAKYRPQLMEATVNELKGRAQKNMMMSRLFESLLGGGDMNGGGGEGIPGNQGNLKAAMIKAFTGVDPYLMTPQQEQDFKTAAAIKQASQKKNIDTGVSDIARESLQNIVSMPKEYMGAFGSAKMTKDRIAAGLGDEDAKERLIQAAVAERLVPEYSGFQLQSQGQRATVPALAHQQQAIRQGWPHVSKALSGYLTPDLQKEVERRHNEAVKKVNQLRESYLSSGGANRDPDIEQAAESPKLKSGAYSWNDIQHTAKLRGISENAVIDKLAELNNMSVDEFMKQVKQQGY